MPSTTTAPHPLTLVNCRLASHFAMEHEANDTLAWWLKRLARPASFWSLFEGLTEAQLQSIARRSYRHGNGFLKIVLLENGYKLRLHIWLPGTPCEENVHDHRWSFASTVLCGSLRSELFAYLGEDPAGEFREFRYEQRQAKPVGRARLLRLSTEVYRAGDAYCLPREVLHRIAHHGENLVATLMCSAPQGEAGCRLLSDREERAPATLNHPLDTDELRAALAVLRGQYPARRP